MGIMGRDEGCTRLIRGTSNEESLGCKISRPLPQLCHGANRSYTYQATSAETYRSRKAPGCTRMDGKESRCLIRDVYPSGVSSPLNSYPALLLQLSQRQIY